MSVLRIKILVFARSVCFGSHTKDESDSEKKS